MPRYLLKIRYTRDGIAGVRKDGGSARVGVASKLLESVGGKLESFDFAFGDVDAYAVVQAPSNAAVSGAAIAVGAAGGATIETVALLTASEVDDAVKNQVQYTSPGT